MRVILVAILLLISSCCVFAQSPNGSLRGIVFDPDSKSIAGAEVIVVNDATGVKYVTSTNADGLYAVENLPPGPYRIQISKFGFKGIIKPDIILNVEDIATLNFTLPIGASSVTVTVEGGAPMINTTDGSVSTVVDRKFVENMPLNGRSFQGLILLTPGVVTNSPQNQGAVGTNGEFSVNGQRTESNYYTVDGVSANLGIADIISYPGSSGSLSASTALGTTQALVSVDALQEFRVESSTYSAEYGRNPGGQFSFATRSGTNQYHGTAFEYIRNGIFDANDWFNNYYGQTEPPLRQNDFGGTIGGPIVAPGLYDGRSKTFFFVSYEGLRLVQPQPASLSYVPATSLRQMAPTTLQPVLNAFPLPHCSSPGANCSEDLGNGFGQFVGTWSNPSAIDSTSVRLDQVVNRNVRLFFRFANTPSNSTTRPTAPLSPANVQTSDYQLRSFTGGSTLAFSSKVGDEFRLNYGSNKTVFETAVDKFDGGQGANLAQLQGLNASGGVPFNIQFLFSFAGQIAAINQNRAIGEQRQWNVVDTAKVLVGRHVLSFGADFRRLSPYSRPFDPALNYYFLSEASAQTNSIDYGAAIHAGSAYPEYRNFSAFAGDEWRVTERWSLSMGLRWEVNPAPGVTQGMAPYTVQGADNLSTMTLAAQGTPLWKTGWYNFAPRLGAAYVLRRATGHELVLRGGAGVFYDTGQQVGSYGFSGPGFRAQANFGTFAGTSSSFPVSPSLVPPIVNPPTAPYTESAVFAYPPHLQLPYTLQWNATVEQALGTSQALTLSYVGSNGRRLLEQATVNVQPFNPNFVTVDFFKNGLTSDYEALQLQYRRRWSHGFSALASYTWAHSIDYGSNDATLPYVRGNSDFDVRHSFGVAVSYDVPSHYRNKFAGATLGHWGIDVRAVARTAFPVNLVGNLAVVPVSVQYFNAGLSLVPGQSIYIFGMQCASVFGFSCPGGRAVNPNAFTVPATGSGDAPRNFVRGFGAWQADLAVRREFPVYERLKLQFRAEAFNLLNHPNFGAINSLYCSVGPGCTFGQATASLAQSLGVLSPLYQMGGPRSMQFALKLMF